MSLSGEGLLILAIIITMMVADIVYDGASHVLLARKAEFCGAVADGQILLLNGQVVPGVTQLAAVPSGMNTSTCESIMKIVAPIANVGVPTEPGWLPGRLRPAPSPRSSSRSSAQAPWSFWRTPASGPTRRWSSSS